MSLQDPPCPVRERSSITKQAVVHPDGRNSHTIGTGARFEQAPLKCLSQAAVQFLKTPQPRPPIDHTHLLHQTRSNFEFPEHKKSHVDRLRTSQTQARTNCKICVVTCQRLLHDRSLCATAHRSVNIISEDLLCAFRRREIAIVMQTQTLCDPMLQLLLHYPTLMMMRRSRSRLWMNCHVM